MTRRLWRDPRVVTSRRAEQLSEELERCEELGKDEKKLEMEPGCRAIENRLQNEKVERRKRGRDKGRRARPKGENGVTKSEIGKVAFRE